MKNNRKPTGITSPKLRERKPFPMKLDKDDMVASTSVPILSNLN